MERSPVKLIVCDIDDTLIHKELHLSPRMIDVIRRVREKGVQFTLATGRMPYRAEVFAGEAKLDIPFIANNGTILYDRGSMVYCRLIDAGQLKGVLHKYMAENPEFTVIFSYPDRERPLVRTRWIEDRLHRYRGYDETLGDTDEVWNQRVHKVYVLDDSRSGLIGRLSKELEVMDGEFGFFQYGEYSIEIVAKGCTKASGLSSLLEYLKIPASEVMAIGDHVNDIEVIRMAGIGVAVANADPKLKAEADYITDGEMAAGVEEAIDRFVFQKKEEMELCRK